MWPVLRNGHCIWARHTKPGFNVTTQRDAQDVAGAAEYLAVFISTHLLGMLLLQVFLWIVFTFVGWSQTYAAIRRNYEPILIYLCMYVIVYVILKVWIGNRTLSVDGQIPRYPRAMTDYLFVFCMWFVVNAIFSALSRVVLYLPVVFFNFVRLDISPLPKSMQKYDFPFRACQSVLALHTRMNNPIATTAATELFYGYYASPRYHRGSGVGDSNMSDTADGCSPRHRTRWHLAYTLLRNPVLRQDRKHVLAALSSAQAPPPDAPVMQAAAADNATDTLDATSASSTV
eukprot:m.975457 g.975457  ORF g.975457 m.975457 type:complete len:287 (+) comp23941_c0_seq1:1972-2832(+)